MVDFALRLTESPGASAREDVERLRRAGFGDGAILDIVQVTAYYNYVNRVASGLGIELEPYRREKEEP
jgi:alkylhydroperoxidase family enzyme